MSRAWYATNYKQVGRTQPEKKLVSGKCKVKINIKIEFSDEKMLSDWHSSIRSRLYNSGHLSSSFYVY